MAQKLKNKNADTDSLINALNTQVNNAAKDINLTGVKEIVDTTMSVFNEYGMKQAVKFDTNRAMNCEIVIPLKYINHLIIGGTFKYNIMLPGITGVKRMTINGVEADPGSMASIPGLTFASRGGGDFMSMFSPTDFSGTYTLAKK